MSNINSKAIVRKLYESHFSVKGVKTFGTGSGHIGENASLYLNGKRVATHEYDGWGGEEDVQFVSNDAEKAVHAKIDELELRRVLFEGEYSFMESIDKVTYSIVINEIICDLINVALAEKEKKAQAAKIKRQTAKGFVYSVGDSTYTMLYQQPMKEIVAAYKNGLEVIQTGYNDAVNNMKELAKQSGEEPVLHNDNEQLKALGITL